MSEIFEVSDKWVVSEEWVRDSNAKLAVTAFNVPMISNLDEFNQPHDPRRRFFGTRRARG